MNANMNGVGGKIIDATNRGLGRVASAAAALLRGKDEAGFRPEHFPALKVTIKNISKMRLSPKKVTEKIYVSYSGYPRGLKKTTLKELTAKKGLNEALRRAVYGMLPKNKSRAKIIKQLILEE